MAFEYQPLSPGEYRVLILLPASWSQELRCALVSGPPHSIPKYEAVSYTWGKPDRIHPVFCNNATQTLNAPGDLDTVIPLRFERVIYVTENLKILLHHFRHDNEPRFLWIDSICINQNDLAERAAQVQIMMNIYHLSQRAIVWLGEEDQHTEAAFTLLAHLVAISQSKPDGILQTGPKCSLPATPFIPNPQHPSWILYVPLFIALKQLLQRPWFKRLWIIQEIVVSREAIVRCGKRSIDWRHLFDACQVLEKRNLFFDDIQGRLYLSVTSIGILRLAYHALYSNSDTEVFESRLSLFEVLLRTLNAESSDPRDKLYALLGIIREEDRQNLRPDYTKSVRDVYIQMARHLCFFKGKPSLTFIGIIPQKTAAHHLPSWVSDWSLSHHATDPISTHGRFRASTDSKVCMEFPPEEQIDETHCCLKIRGVCLLTIETVQHPSPGPSSDRGDHCATLNSYRDPYPTTDQSYLEIYPKIVSPTKGEDFHRSDEPTCNFWDYVKACESGEHAVKSESDHLRYRPQDVNTCLSELHIAGILGGASQRRNFFTCTLGFMGLVPKEAQVGDKICILFGAERPFVIRESSSSWTMVGECYVHGVMNGEAMDGLPENRVQEFEFI